MKKVKAYTLAEVIVVLLISAIVFSTIFTTLLIINKLGNNFNKKRYFIQHVLMARQAINDDFLNADSVKLDEKAGKIMCYKETGELVSYNFEDSFLVRTNFAHTDSFRFSASIRHIDFAAETKFVQLMELSIFANNDTFPFVVEKYYDATVLIQSTASQ